MSRSDARNNFESFLNPNSKAVSEIKVAPGEEMGQFSAGTMKKVSRVLEIV